MIGRIYHVAENGTDTNITEGVQALYDLVIASTDWGSGFLSVEEALPVVHVAKACGFTGWEEAEHYVTRQQYSEEQQRFLKKRAAGSGSWVTSADHYGQDHVFSSTGKCMWPSCNATES